MDNEGIARKNPRVESPAQAKEAISNDELGGDDARMGLKVKGWEFCGEPRWKWYLRRLHPVNIKRRVSLWAEVRRYKNGLE